MRRIEIAEAELRELVAREPFHVIAARLDCDTRTIGALAARYGLESAFAAKAATAAEEAQIAAWTTEGWGREFAEVAKSAGREIELHGWTPLVPELLMKNHILIGKAGGAATQEAIAAKTPMIITKAVPGQEEGNARLIVENGCGALCKTNDAIVATVSRLTASNAQLWHQWHAAIRGISSPNAARDIARFILTRPSKLKVER